MQAFVDGASRNNSLDGAGLIKGGHIMHNRLLDLTNPLLGNNLDLVAQAHKANTRAITKDEACTFLASSSLCHSLDGWIYLSHAMDSFLKGDLGIAVHLAYYAELRGSMSFLATEGIAVLNNHHIRVDGNGNVGVFNARKGTHIFTWEAINHYILSPSKPKEDLLKAFQCLGKNFFEWFSAIPRKNLLMADKVIQEWLKEWSFDISHFTTDRNLRNELSYRPRKLQYNSISQIEEPLHKLSSFWRPLEPQNSSRFKLLDDFLLKKFLKKIHEYIEIALQTPYPFEQLLEETFQALNLQLSASQRSFFTSQNDHQLFVSAKNTVVSTTGDVNPLSIIARATLLLRLSIGYSTRNLSAAGITKAELHFFLNSIGVNSGYWNNNNIPNDFALLWDDVGDALTSIEGWLNGRTQDASLNELTLELAQELTFYKQITRAGLWGVHL